MMSCKLPIALLIASISVGCSNPNILTAAYGCGGLSSPESSGIDIVVETHAIRAQKSPEFDISGLRLNGHTLYEVDIRYYDSNIDGSDAQPSLEYKNVEFEYENRDLIIKVPETDGFPNCRVKMRQSNQVVDHICEPELTDKGNRAKTFSMKCSRQGKMGFPR